MSEVVQNQEGLVAQDVSVGEPPYFKQGEAVTVEAVHNGFVVYTEGGNYVAGDVQQMLSHLLTSLTNHGHYAQKMQREQASVVQEPTGEVDINTEETV